MAMVKFKNYKKAPVHVHCKATDRVCTFKPMQERELHESWEDALLSHGLVPMDAVARVEESESAAAEAAEAEAAAAAEAEAAEASERAAVLAKANEQAAIEAEKAKRSAAALKGAATKKANAAKASS